MRRGNSGDHKSHVPDCQYDHHQPHAALQSPVAGTFGPTDNVTVKLRGLPYIATIEDLSSWLTGNTPRYVMRVCV